MAKRKAAKREPEDEVPQGEHDDLSTNEQHEQGMPAEDEGAGVKEGEGAPNPAGNSPYQAYADGRHEHKPAEPTSVMSAEEIPPIDARYARPMQFDDGSVAGAGDPQNGVAPRDMPPDVSMVPWARPDPSTAQHYPWAEGEPVVGAAGKPQAAPATTQRGPRGEDAGDEPEAGKPTQGSTTVSTNPDGTTRAPGEGPTEDEAKPIQGV